MKQEAHNMQMGSDESYSLTSDEEEKQPDNNPLQKLIDAGFMKQPSQQNSVAPAVENSAPLANEEKNSPKESVAAAPIKLGAMLTKFKKSAKVVSFQESNEQPQTRENQLVIDQTKA